MSRTSLGRRGARRMVLEALYAWEAEGELNFQEGGDHLDTRSREYAHELFAGIRDNLIEVDSVLKTSCQGWSFDRLGRVERNILRVAVFEMLWSSLPPAVAINEAVDMAREFAGQRSGSFINGVLMRALDGQEGRDEE